MARPIYTPSEKIQKSLYTSGKELMFVDTNEEYIGLFHQYPNGSIYSELEFNEQSRQLINYIPSIETENGSIYYKLTKKRFNNYIAPKYYYPIPTDSNYKSANITRFFVQQRNNLSHIIEVDFETYNNINNKNERGIDAGLYRKISIQWTISGPLEEVRKANQRVLQLSPITNLSNYLTDLIEFYK